ncbi:VCBS repeat-containing protein [Fulvivirgaceae bacterium BMA10]|uniref:VCBS repeat-containing protein n=1 Tax=Splendidivirga corallicola TaxID=3051826 RepID=A0ABT8KU51_9BACT|nr:VCBS repeat-containing protein [Fulvivirgaceae bacterium BMA10]
MFELVSTDHSGITFSNNIKEDYSHFVDHFNYVYNGAGVAIGDINNDGLSDIYFTGNEVPNKLYLNKGHFKFEDITSNAGVGGGNGWHNGVTMVDINHDGYLDIYVCKGGWQDTPEERENLLFVNQKDLTFKEQSADYGLNDAGFSMMASFFDMDNDNDLDVYITNRPDSFFIPLEEFLSHKKNAKNHNRDKLYQNMGQGVFKEIGKQAGIDPNWGYGLGLVTADVDQDGFTDIYVANDFVENDYFYKNNGDGTFSESIKAATRHISLFSMGVDIADIDNDGWEDIFVSEMLPEDYIRSKTTMAPMNRKAYQKILDMDIHNQYMHNMLQYNQGKGVFSEISQLSGTSTTDWSWACFLADFDNDSYRDLFVSNGYKRDVYNKDTQVDRVMFLRENIKRFSSLDEAYKELAPQLISMYETNQTINYFFRNNGDLTFSNKSSEWGIQDKSFSNGAAYGDLDNDGDLDLVVNNIDHDAFVYRNNSETAGVNYLRIKLIGPEENPLGIGAKITLKYDDKIQYEEFKIVRGYLSSVEPIAHFGLDTVSRIESLEIEWKDGKTSLLENVPVNQNIKVDYKDAGIASNSNLNLRDKVPFFAEAASKYFSTPFRHLENKYDDYERQVLLPHKKSQVGPFIATGDVDGNGLEDFYIGGAAGQSGQLYLQHENGSFDVTNSKVFETDKNHEDIGLTFFDADQDNDLDLYVVSGGYEFDENDPLLSDRLYINNGKGNFSRSDKLPDLLSNGSCVETSDIDKDGDLDVFVGGHVIPGKYPFAAKSRLLLNENGRFIDVTESIAPGLSNIGMVTSASWTDIDADGDPDLIVVGEWMPISVFENEMGRFKNVTEKYGLQNTTGWWNKIISTDYDQDGDIDFIAGNLGLNYKFHASEKEPFHIYAADFDQNGTVDPFLVKYYGSQQVPIRGRECSSEQISAIGDRFPTYKEFALADITNILGPDIETALHYEAHMFESIILDNQNGEFASKPLPTKAQFSTINGIVCNDFDEDGYNDLLIAGNNLDVEVETTRADASIGYFLKGNQDQGFIAVEYEKSGVYLPYNVKDLQMIRIGREQITGILVSSGNDNLRLLIKNRLTKTF